MKPTDYTYSRSPTYRRKVKSEFYQMPNMKRRKLNGVYQVTGEYSTDEEMEEEEVEEDDDESYFTDEEIIYTRTSTEDGMLLRSGHSLKNKKTLIDRMKNRRSLRRSELGTSSSRVNASHTDINTIKRTLIAEFSEDEHIEKGMKETKSTKKSGKKKAAVINHMYGLDSEELSESEWSLMNPASRGSDISHKFRGQSSSSSESSVSTSVVTTIIETVTYITSPVITPVWNTVGRPVTNVVWTVLSSVLSVLHYVLWTSSGKYVYASGKYITNSSWNLLQYFIMHFILVDTWILKRRKKALCCFCLPLLLLLPLLVIGSKTIVPVLSESSWLSIFTVSSHRVIKESDMSQSKDFNDKLALLNSQILENITILQNQLNAEIQNNQSDGVSHSSSTLLNIGKLQEEISDLRTALGNVELSQKALQIQMKNCCQNDSFYAMTIQAQVNRMLHQVVEKIVEDALLRYSADKLEMPDFALESAGGSIVSTRCSQTYHRKTAQYSILGIPLWYVSNSPRTVIQPEIHPGSCWAFQGSQGYLVIELSTVIKPTGFTLEHIPKSLTPDGKITSAPKDFTVLGLSKESDTQGKHLGNFTYEDNGKPLQHFLVKDIEGFFKFIELRITSNHGNQMFTCLYRFRVHGTPS